MAVHISLNGNSSGAGFLLAPLDAEYEAEIALWTDSGETASVTLQASPSPDPAALVFSTTAVINISPTPTFVSVHAMQQSGSQGDTVIQVIDGTAAELASFTVTSIKHPMVNFSGRFQARFATDAGFFNTSPTYSSDPLDNPVPWSSSNGWTWVLEGEPSFVPPAVTDNVPVNLEQTGIGRVIRLNSPVALRNHANAVVSTVKSITGETSSGTVTFLMGDPLIGQPVNFGPDTYFAGNNPRNPADPSPEEFFSAAREPLGLFEIRLGTSFSPPALYFTGASMVGPVGSGQSAGLNRKRRMPDSRPIVQGPPFIRQATAAEMAEFTLTDLTTFTENRIDELVAEYLALPSGPSQDRRNLVRRIGHLLGFLATLDPVPAKVATVQALATPPDVFTLRITTLTQAFPDIPNWDFKEYYKGKVDTDLHAWPGGSPGASSMVDFLRQFFSFDIEWSGFAFHSDELCGHHIGKLSGDETMTGNHIGDPHTRTVNGINYDFQSVGEFTLLRDGDKMEVQARHTPVAAANPITDSYSGLKVCVSITTAIAARVGSHRISLQPDRERKQLQFFLDGKPARLLARGTDLSGHRVSGFDANGETGLRVDYLDGTVLIATPAFWNSYSVWYINVSISHTKANEGIMGHVPKESWLPRLRNGKSVGPKPSNLHDRYVTLYKTFADSWRVTDQTSLFVYEQGNSTKKFTDPDWPSEQPPCNIKPELQIPGAPVLKGMPIEKAEKVCKLVTMDDLHKKCVFDVATTGDELFARGYIFEQELRMAGTTVLIIVDNLPSNPKRLPNEPRKQPSKRPAGGIIIGATVVSLTQGQPTPKGKVTFYVDDKTVGTPVLLDQDGSATLKMTELEKGTHSFRAAYIPEDKTVSHGSSSTTLRYTVKEGIHGKKGGLFRRWGVWVLLAAMVAAPIFSSQIKKALNITDADSGN